MKIIIVACFLALISLGSSTQIKRTDRKNKSQAKASSSADTNGSGSWKDGYVIPGIRSSLSTSFSGNYIGGDKTKIKPKNICKTWEERTGISKVGMRFEGINLSKGNTTLKSLLVNKKDKEDDKILHYCSLSGAHYVNPTFDYKYIEVKHVSQKDLTNMVAIGLPYAKISYIISDDEGKELASCINDNADRCRREGNLCRQKIIEESGKFYQNKKGLKELGPGKALEDLKKHAQAELTRLENEKKTAEKSVEDLTKNFSTLNTEIVSLRDGLNAELAARDELIAQRNSILESIKQLKEQKEGRNLQNNGFSSQIDQSYTKFENTINSLLVLAPELNRAENGDENAFTNSLTSKIDRVKKSCDLAGIKSITDRIKC